MYKDGYGSRDYGIMKGCPHVWLLASLIISFSAVVNEKKCPNSKIKANRRGSSQSL